MEMADGSEEAHLLLLPAASVTTARIYVGAAGCSLACCSLVLLLHARSRRLSQFPSSIMLWRIVCDWLLCAQLIVLNVPLLGARDQPVDGNAACGPALAFLAQFSLFGSLGWYACLALNLYLSVTRPFTRPSERMGIFHAWVWLGSTATGIFAASHHGFRPLYQLCWIEASPSGKLNFYNWALLGGWVVGYPLLSTLALVHCEWAVRFDRDREHRATRLRPRLLQLRASRIATAVFSAFWGGLGGVYLYMYFRYDVLNASIEEAARNTFAIFIGLLGTCDAAVWIAVQLAVNRTALTVACGRQAGMGTEDRAAVRADDISDALRREFVRNTIVGIVTSTRVVNAEAITVYPSRSRQMGAPEPPGFHGDTACCCDSARSCYGLIASCCRCRYQSIVPRRQTGIRHPSIDRVSLSTLKEPLLLREALPLAASSEQAVVEDLASSSRLSNVLRRGRFGRFTTPTGDFFDSAIPQLSRSHFNEVWTLQVAPGVYFQDYAPMVWQALRQLVYHVSFKSYIFSLEGEGQLQSFIDKMVRASTVPRAVCPSDPPLVRNVCLCIQVGNFSEGRSGGFFFTSADKRYLVKTLARKEQRRLLKILPRYYEYLRTNPRSLLSRFYGCYCITMHGQSCRFAVMENVFHAADLPLNMERYDLKGSWISRSARSTATTRLDCDLKRVLHLPADIAKQLVAQCASDAELLRSLNLMDYSLLLGVERGAAYSMLTASSAKAALSDEVCTPTLASSSSSAETMMNSESGGGEQEPLIDTARKMQPQTSYPALRSRAISLSHQKLRGPITYGADPMVEPGVVYYLAIIDLLQTWDWSKRLEHWCKVFLYCRCSRREAKGMSAVEPSTYARRFVSMIRRVLGSELVGDVRLSSRSHRSHRVPLSEGRDDATMTQAPI